MVAKVTEVVRPASNQYKAQASVRVYTHFQSISVENKKTRQ